MILEELKRKLENAPTDIKNWRRSRYYRYWRAYIILSQKRCQICGSIKNREAHHIKSARYYKKYRFDVNNGICLCNKCHSLFHYKFMGSSRKKCNNKDLERFLKISNFYINVGSKCDKSKMKEYKNEGVLCE